VIYFSGRLEYSCTVSVDIRRQTTGVKVSEPTTLPVGIHTKTARVCGRVRKLSISLAEVSTAQHRIPSRKRRGERERERERGKALIESKRRERSTTTDLTTAQPRSWERREEISDQIAHSRGRHTSPSTGREILEGP
jgi:hypothetical protein